MRLLLAVVVWGWCWHAMAAEDPFAFTPPADKGMIETPFGPAPAVRDWPKDKPQALANGIKAYDAGDFETAKKWLLPLAEKGHAVAMNQIGYMVDDGDGFPKDSVAACDWYKHAAEQGHLFGQFNFGTCYLVARGRPKNLDQAARWLWPGADDGDKFNRFKLSSIFHQKGDRDQDIFWLKKAAESGSKDAAFGLYGFGVKLPDFSWFDLACIWFATETGKPFGYCDD